MFQALLIRNDELSKLITNNKFFCSQIKATISWSSCNVWRAREIKLHSPLHLHTYIHCAQVPLRQHSSSLSSWHWSCSQLVALSTLSLSLLMLLLQFRILIMWPGVNWKWWMCRVFQFMYMPHMVRENIRLRLPIPIPNRSPNTNTNRTKTTTATLWQCQTRCKLRHSRCNSIENHERKIAL